jgi:hypothetical protein
VKAILHDRPPIMFSAERLANEIRITISRQERQRLLITG